MQRWARCSFYKKCVETRYAKPVFLPPAVSVGHVMHSGVFGAPNDDGLFFLLGWAWCGFHKKHVETRYTKLVFSIWWDLRVK
jgi:hypothetical protein